MTRPRRLWTPEEDAILLDLFPDHRSSEVAERLGRPLVSVCHRARRLGLRKSPEFLASNASGQIQKGERRSSATQFQPGNRPWNAGTKGLMGNNPKSVATRFKPGNVSGAAAARLQPLGAERVVDGYLRRKVNDDLPRMRRWKAVHVLVWEEVHGPVPPGHVVAFRRGLHTTVAAEITVDRLELVTRAEMMRRNSYHNTLPDDVKCLVQLKGQLTRKINTLERANDEKQG